MTGLSTSPIQTVPAAPRRDRVIALAALAAITLLGFALRAWLLDRESLWRDEAMSIRVASGSFASIIAFTAQDVHPPLYYFALHVWMGLAGTSVVAVRLLSAIFGALTIPLLYRAGSRLFDRTTGLVAAALLATTVLHVNYGQEARMYSLLALLSLWSVDSTFRLLRGDAGRLARVSSGLSTALMLYTHVYAVFIVAAELGAAALLFALDRETFRRTWKSFVLAQALAFVLYVPWLFALAYQVSQVQQNYWVGRIGFIGVWSAINGYAGSWALSKILRSLALVGAVAGLLGYPRRNGAARWTAAMLLLWIAGPLVLPWIVSQVARPIFLARCTIAASLAFYLLVARGVTLMPGRVLRAALVTGILVLNAVAVHGYFGVIGKEQWREAAAHIGATARAGDLLLFDRAYGQIPFDYYLARRDLVEEPCLAGAEAMPESEFPERIDRLVEGHQRIWLVVSSPDPVTPVALDRLGRRGRLEHTARWRGVQVYLFIGQGQVP